MSWTLSAVTVAGGRQPGNANRQLHSPYGLCVDDKGVVIIADWGNNRIVECNPDGTTGRVVAAGHGSGMQPNQLQGPTDVLLDKEANSVTICDMGNRRVMRWSLRSDTTSGKTIITDIDCWGLTTDSEGYLYVTDTKKHEVKRYCQGETSGTVVAGGNGPGNGLHQLNTPTYVLVDADRAVYVSDYHNDRVMKWVKGAREGIVVAGGRGKGSDLTRLNGPHGLYVDAVGTVYVVDCGNDRVMRYCRCAKQQTILVGGKGQGQGATQLVRPTGLSFDQQHNLYVVDNGNHRVQRFAVVEQ